MEFKHWKDADGYTWKEITTRNYMRLLDLKEEYRKKGKKTWLEILDLCQGIFVLTVLES